MRVIDENGAQLGVLSLAEALATAKSRELDLIEIVPVARPPVCKIMDFGTYKYRKMKDNLRKKKSQKKLDLKGVQLSIRTAEHDLKFKGSQTDKFLGKGHPVKIEIRLRGREKANATFAIEKLRGFVANYVTTPMKLEQDVKKSGFGFTMILRKK